MGKPADYGPILNGVMWFQVIISSVFIMLRIYTRYYIIRSLGWDDLMMVVNLVSLLSFCLCALISSVPLYLSMELQRRLLTLPGDIYRFHRHHFGRYHLRRGQEDRGYCTSWPGQFKSHLLGSHRPGDLYCKSEGTQLHHAQARSVPNAARWALLHPKPQLLCSYYALSCDDGTLLCSGA